MSRFFHSAYVVAAVIAGGLFAVFLAETLPLVSEVLFAAGDVLLVVAGVLLTLFLALFHWKVDWRASPMGRNIMHLMGSLWACYLLIILPRVFGPEYLGREVLRIFVYASLCWAIFQRGRLLLMAQRKEQKVSDDLMREPRIVE